MCAHRIMFRRRYLFLTNSFIAFNNNLKFYSNKKDNAENQTKPNPSNSNY